jgi:hypothetical protein
MTILIGKYEFDGPYHKVDDLEEKQGLYAVLHYKDDEYKLIHVAQADNIRERIELLPAPDSPEGKVLLAALYTPRCGRRERSTMVESIQSELDDGDSAPH